MQIKKAVYQYGFALPEQYQPGELPEIAVAGKSNVGKSSFINMLTNHGSLSRVGATPGKTRIINAFCINDSFLLMDLPGYGYARVSDAEKDRWGNLIEKYLRGSRALKCVLLLLDIRHSPTEGDKQMLSWLHYYHIPFCIIATKADKLSRPQLQNRLLQLSRETGIIKNQIYPVSALQKTGKEAVLERLDAFLTPVPETTD